ncbi:coenzyme F420-0:L-glutamate ligase [Pseudanabaena mucicola]|uniref:F420-0:Gamma-glutamyl ligase n=1 Tax=Pseudanabaena mucicola FACHB-723 TaxID=2692860 RepID=A0ABR8A018_9CYAN|nr:coenzyme F420-0:L-glutamate ligase [Pseudanabaena mucicola]MBD2189548.1 F420-0:Gamma-glutamyl ligase [Pseudanabaena mucicola FACHB-723]
MNILIGIGIAIAILGGIILLLWLLFEWQYKTRQGNLLEFDNGTWQFLTYEPEHYRLELLLNATNKTRKLDVFLVEVDPQISLLSSDSLDDITTKVELRSRHPNLPSRRDNYWESYIVTPRHSTGAEIQIDISGKNLESLKTVWVRVHYTIYGPAGREQKVKHCIIPLQFPATDQGRERWRPTPDADVLPIRTHILSAGDNPVEVLQRYVMSHAQTGDIVTIAETPIAIMQGNFYHPSDIQPKWLAKRLCYYFKSTSSLATACGLQSLINESGAWRVGFAFVIGALAKAFLRVPGVFYMLAGDQARLIDDVTGTLPPYDQFIVLGPKNPQAVVDEIKTATGLEAAIVDVNDLRRVKVLAATSGVSEKLLNQALIMNPAGNAAEQTPIVLIRPNTGA